MAVDEEFNLSKFIEQVREDMCDGYCKYPHMEIPEGRDNNWLSEPGSPCENCPMTKL